MINDSTTRKIVPLQLDEEEDTSDLPTLIVPVTQYRKEEEWKNEEDPFWWIAQVREGRVTAPKAVIGKPRFIPAFLITAKKEFDVIHQS